MIDRPFVVTGCGRSGTSFLARLLTNAGLRTSHEEYFTPYTTEYDPVRFREWLRKTGTVAEVSGFAAPFSRHIHSDMPVVRLVRNPMHVVNSILGLGQFRPENQHVPAVKFLYRWAQELDSDNHPLITSVACWIEWNRLTYASYMIKVEILRLIDWQELFGVNPLPEHWDAASIRRNAGSPARFTLDMIPQPLHDKLIEAAAIYGYTEEDLCNPVEESVSM